MKSTRKILSLILALIFILSLSSCGVFKPPVNTDTDTGAGGTDTDTSGGAGADGEFSEEAFTVSLRYHGQHYIPTEEITVMWTADKKIASAKINSKGIAGVEGLDGDYRVTLSNLPARLAYNPNVYMATNDQRNVVIDIYDIQRTTGNGTGLYTCIEVSKTAVYEVELKSPEHIVYYQFRPTTPGMYTVESWMDTTAEKYNPYCDLYTGTFAAKWFDKTVDDGGTEGIYTKNFLGGIDVSQDMIGNVLTYGVHVDAKNQDNYPVKVIFAIQLNGGFESLSQNEYDMYVKQESEETYLAGRIEYDDTKFELVGAERPLDGRENAYLFDETMYKLWKKEDGGDNFYHLYNEEEYPETGGYGPILYAYITLPTRFVDRAFTVIEQEAKDLSLVFPDGRRINYKHFIEGYTDLATRNEGEYNGGSYYCDEYCPCHEGQDTDMACTSDCPNDFCRTNCRHIKPENIGFEGIQAYANSDGLVAVTEEIKIFLYQFSVGHRYFADGEGWVETTGFIKRDENGKAHQCTVDSNDASQWLYACAYYKEIK
jgi:hypothetical protein